MQTVRVIFSRRRNLGSLLLRTIMWSAWSHCAIVDDGLVIEAVAGKGVRARSLGAFLADTSRHEIVDIPVPDAAAVVMAACSQLGKPYDWLGVLSIGFHRRWQKTDAWFCSELVAWAFAQGGRPLFRVDAWRIRPHDLYIRTY